MYYVYILQSSVKSETRYIGFTTNLKNRLSDHNSGSSPHTSKYKPWILVNYFAFRDKNKAYKFEKYLKSASGRAFSKHHFL
ncbi:MAG: GIY-YIG nuclease family protein [Chlamydiota bacterium]|nr:GIY-YIG nuclease family protein [Chlamydiota bacterium]